jgi:hypothetical protein
VYVDGVLRGSGTGPAGSRSWPPGLRIGVLQDGGGGSLNGAIDDVRLYARILSTSEIVSLAAGPLPSPQNVTATPGSSKISLSWSAVSGATDYIVRRSSSSGGPYTDLVNGISSTSYMDLNLNDGATWSYTVTANGLSGSGAASAPISMTTYTAMENWRMANFGSMANSGTAADSADPDGDGSTNAQEMVAGTNPKNPTSYLKMSGVTKNGSDVILSFPTVTGKTYRLERSNTLLNDSWTTMQNNIAGTGGTVQITDPAGAASGRCFYRLIVQQ